MRSVVAVGCKTSYWELLQAFEMLWQTRSEYAVSGVVWNWSDVQFVAKTHDGDDVGLHLPVA